MRRAVIGLATVVVLGFAGGSGALAQSTGGSMGGGSWSGGGSSSSGSSYSSGGSSGGYYSSSRGGRSSDSPPPLWVLVLGLTVIGGFVVVSLVDQVRGDLTRERAKLARRSAGRESIDVSALRLGIDWRARAWVQGELDRIARGADTSTPTGLHGMLHDVAHVLRRSKDSWLYAGVADAAPMRQQVAQGRFQQLVGEAREKFRDELIRAVDGGVSEAELLDELVPRSHEGEGLVVVTIVIATRGVITDFGDMRSVESVRSWLEILDYLPARDLVACEVIWSPADPDDRMSSVELEARYPRLRKLRSGVVTGRTQCRYCSGFFPGELRTCPHCGARSDAADAA